ncbi:MAG TPA: hypothetical protein VMN35_03475 [Gaiellaceae bacterium]|nr:hypothetical protein [Gaiellaceae bacterium]
MTSRPPDLDDLVGELEPGARERLERVHALLVAVDAPPELPAGLSSPPAIAKPHARAVVRRAGRALALAAALAVTAFALGVVTGDRLAGPGTFDVIAFTGTGNAHGASASLEVFDLDAAGNWPMELRVRGLEPAADGGRYELWLTRDGELAELCGSFLAEPDGTTVVPMNAPWRLDAFDGWVVVEEGSRAPVLET